MLGLDRGGACEGMAFRVKASDAAATLAYLREREQVISVYREALVPVTLMTPERPEVMALAFLVERAHPSYAGRLPLVEQANLIRGATGRSGSNIDYLVSRSRTSRSSAFASGRSNGWWDWWARTWRAARAPTLRTPGRWRSYRAVGAARRACAR